MKLNYRQSRILEEIANTFIAPVNGKSSHPEFWLAKGADKVAPEKIAVIIASQPAPAREEFLQLLKLLDSNLLGLTWGGPIKKFLALSPLQREKMLAAWSGSKVGKLRKAFATMKKLCTFLYYSASEKAAHPAFEAMAYPGPFPAEADTCTKIPTLQIEKDTILSCEVLIVGSGAGGGVFAGELAAAGKDVIVVEKGPYLEGNEFTQHEGDMIGTLYEGMGAIASSNGEINLLAGSCLGGGTTVNWSGSFHTPDYIRDEWATNHLVPFFREKEFLDSLDAVAKRLSVNSTDARHNFQNQMLWNGSTKLGQEVRLIPRNEKEVTDADVMKLGFSGMGDRYGKKQGCLQTYLRQSVNNGARIICSCHVEKISIKNGRAIGAEAVYTGKGGEKRKLFIQADKIVVAAGAIHTPVILKRSGIEHAHIGRNLHLHPTVGVTGIYHDKSEPWFGPMMSVVNDHFTRLKDNYGFKLETPPTHPGVIAMSLPWTNAAAYKEELLKAAHMASFIAICRDKDPGYISIDKKGRPIIHYQLSKFDLKHIIKGMEEASRIHVENNCEAILYPHYSNKRFNNNGKRAEFEKFLHDLPVWGWRPNQFAMYSAHQMATCRMGGDSKTHPTSPEGNLHAVSNVYIGDASAFPSASGANPMLTIMALAHHTAQGLK